MDRGGGDRDNWFCIAIALTGEKHVQTIERERDTVFLSFSLAFFFSSYVALMSSHQ